VNKKKRRYLFMNPPLNGRTLDFDRDGNCLAIIDQTLLPNEEKILRLETKEEIFEAIRSLRVRGAPAIGVAAAIGFAVTAGGIKNNDKRAFFNELDSLKEYFAACRPTARNLFWALERMRGAAENNKNAEIEDIKQLLKDEAEKIIIEDIEICRKIGENGAALLNDGDTILTHCNAGRLAAVEYGTALAPVYIAAERGMKIKVYADETRPLLQGARLTAYELCEKGIDTTVICDNMAASLMAKGTINAIFVGADRIAANGDAANKIGTLPLAIAAKYFGVPFYVCAPLSTFDKNCLSGADIIIEERSGDEISTLHYKERKTPENAKYYNPAFDVTPRGLITAIITEDIGFRI